MICSIDNLIRVDQLVDKLENRMNGLGDDKGSFGTFFD